MQKTDCGHQAFIELLPWYVNGTLDDVDMQHFENHLVECKQCRDDVESELRFSHCYLSATKYSTVGVLETSDNFDRLAEALDRNSLNRRVSSLTVTFATVALIIGICASGIFYWNRAAFHTLTSSDIPTSGVVYQVVFEKGITDRDIRNIFEELGVAVLSGPSPQRVYRISFSDPDRAEAAAAFIKSSQDVTLIERELQ